MARYPRAVWRPLPEDHDQPHGVKGLVIVHSAVGRGSLFDYFARRDVGLESTFWVSKKGLVEQYLDSAVRADANRNANGRAISIETEDDGDPDHQPWTVAQLDALIELVAWCCDTHAIPRVRATSPTGRGVGFHTMWGAPSAWTPVAKTCPGAIRIGQFDTVLLPRLTHDAGPPPAADPHHDQEDDDVDPRTFRWPNGDVATADLDGGVRCYGARFCGSVPMLPPQHRQGFMEAGGAGALRPVDPGDSQAGYIVHRRDGNPFKFDRDQARALGL